jgi:hypothetical protein
MDATVGLQTLVARSGELVYSAVEGDVTMMNVQTGKYYGLTTVGARIWALLEHPTSVDAVCDQLISEYRVGRETCEAEVLTFLQRMAEEGAITVIAPLSGAGNGR